MPDLEALLDWFRTSGVGQQMEEEATAKARARRRAVLDTLLTSERDREGKRPGLEQACAKAREKIAKLRTALETGEREYRVADQARRELAWTTDRYQAELRHELRETCDPRITQTARQIVGVIEDIRREPPHRTEQGYGWMSGEPYTVASNRLAIQRKLESLIAATVALGELAETHVEDVPAAIEAIVAKVPGGVNAAPPPVERLSASAA